MSCLKLSACALAFGMLSQAYSADEKIVTVCNTTGIPVSDLHITFAGSGGSLFVDPLLVFSPPCPVPAVPSNGIPTATTVIDFGAACVAPWQYVTFRVTTPNGPLSYVSGHWTLNGVNVGPIHPGCIRVVSPPPPIPPPPPQPFWAKKWQKRCVFLGPTRKTRWRGIPGTPCWGRWILKPPYVAIARKVRCQYISRNGRVLETRRCITLVPWRVTWFRPARFCFQRTTIRPPDLNRPGDLVIFGPPRNNARRGINWGWRLPMGLDVYYSDNNGQTFQVGDDLGAALFGTYENLNIDRDTMVPVETFTQVLQELGPGYISAGQRLGQVIPHLQSVVSSEPGASCGSLITGVNQISMSLIAIGNDMSDGVIQQPINFTQLRNGLQQFMVGLSTQGSDPRWSNAIDICQLILEGLDVAAFEAQSGLITQQSQDYFLWGLMNRATPNFHVLAHAMGPHARIDLDLGDRGWEPSEQDGVQVQVRRPGNLGSDAEMMLPISTNGIVIVPTYGYESEAQIEVNLKFDTFVSTRVPIPLPNSSSPPPIVVTLQNGDVNGDDLVNAIDLSTVIQDQGLGGPTADDVPSSDLNNDGIVNNLDLNLVTSSQGAIGTGFQEVQVQVELQDSTISPIEEAQFELTDLNGNTITGTSTLSDDGEFSVPVAGPGAYTLRVRGRTWLSQSRMIFVGPGSLPFEGFSLLNGDVDGNNEVGPADFAILASHFGEEAGSLGYDAYADLNQDGEVGPADFAILAQNFGEEGT